MCAILSSTLCFLICVDTSSFDGEISIFVKQGMPYLGCFSAKNRGGKCKSTNVRHCFVVVVVFIFLVLTYVKLDYISYKKVNRGMSGKTLV